MKHHSIFSALIGLLLLSSCEQETLDKQTWELVWADEFETPTPDNRPDPRKWTYDLGAGGWGNQEEQYYTDRVENVCYTSHQGTGCLKITALKDGYGGTTYSSARIKTQGLFEQQYGRFEARMKLPYGPGMWPAFWMLGSNHATDGWPACGEIDIMEYRGYQPNVVSSALHMPGRSGGNPVTQTFGYEHSRFDTDFHVFAVEWDASKIDFFVDNVLYKRVKPSEVSDGEWVYHHPFFILINLAVGGTFGGSPNESTEFPQSLYIDYVRVYKATDK